ncbi:hypothetical protein VTK26DRAFT_5155 [Humicola hyalothermophila]
MKSGGVWFEFWELDLVYAFEFGSLGSSFYYIFFSPSFWFRYLVADGVDCQSAVRATYIPGKFKAITRLLLHGMDDWQSGPAKEGEAWAYLEGCDQTVFCFFPFRLPAPCLLLVLLLAVVSFLACLLQVVYTPIIPRPDSMRVLLLLLLLLSAVNTIFVVACRLPRYC